MPIQNLQGQQVDAGLPLQITDESYILHHFTTRTVILNVISNSEHAGLNIQQLETLVKFHISQIPSYKQANMLKAEYVKICNELCHKNYGVKIDSLSVDDLRGLKIEALLSVESLISEIIDDDIGIRKRTTIGTT